MVTPAYHMVANRQVDPFAIDHVKGVNTSNRLELREFELL